MSNERRRWAISTGVLALGCVALIALAGSLIISRSELASGAVDQSIDDIAAGGTRAVLGWWAHAASGTLAAAVAVAVSALTVGVLLGAFATLGPAIADSLLARSVEIVGLLPTVIVVALVQAIQSEPSAAAFIATLGVVRSLETARIVRGRILQLMAEDFITAARALGVSNWQLFRRHLLPHVVAAALVSALLTIAIVVATDAALSFLGLRTTARLPSWGDVLGVAPRKGYWSLSIAAAAGLVATVGACFLLVDALSEKARVPGTQR